ncbi:MAG: SPASM domain-containing protein [Cyclobacteriaceae bacterium]|nr:SPASM domain-containing protein [Cyclobacteriaceae bacterium]
MSWNDHFRMLRAMTPLRFFNATGVLASYAWSRLTGRLWSPPMPLSLSVEPTTSCNLRCPECPSGLRSFTRPTGNLDAALFRRIIDQVSDHVAYLTFYFQGEPYLHPEFLDMVREAKQRNIYTATSTNAHYLTSDRARLTVESGLDRLIISIDGTTQDTYAAYRIGGSLEKVLQGTREIVRWKRELQSATPHVIFQFLVVKPNEHQIDEVHQLARELGVDEVKLKTAQIYDYEKGSPLIPTRERFARYRMLPDGSYTIKNQLLNHCWKMWHSAVVTWDGKIVPCCFDKDASHVMGDLQAMDFRSIWKGDAYKSFRRSLMRARKEIDICQNCTEGTKVFA